MKNIYIILLVFLVASCSTKQEIVDNNPASSVLDYPRFEKSDVDGSFTDSRYSLSQVNVGQEYLLKHHGRVFFNGNRADHYYLHEIFKDRFLFITVNKKPNIWSSVSLIPRDSVFMYDMGSRELFHFNANAFRISSVKFKHPLRKTKTIIEQQRNGYTVGAIIDSIDIINKELHLLLEDNKSKAVLKLESVSLL
tara:strand:+ start:205 stop:786 length:582 start_codon:yes stop_codon:yes gene_type:complete